MRLRGRRARGGKGSPSEDNHGVGGKNLSDSGSTSSDGLCTRCGAGDAGCEGRSFLVLTDVEVLKGGDGGVCTGAVEAVDAELGGRSCGPPPGVWIGLGDCC
jgi:hypothetical protein